MTLDEDEIDKKTALTMQCNVYMCGGVYVCKCVIISLFFFTICMYMLV